MVHSSISEVDLTQVSCSSLILTFVDASCLWDLASNGITHIAREVLVRCHAWSLESVFIASIRENKLASTTWSLRSPLWIIWNHWSIFVLFPRLLLQNSLLILLPLVVLWQFIVSSKRHLPLLRIHWILVRLSINKVLLRSPWEILRACFSPGCLALSCRFFVKCKWGICS